MKLGLLLIALLSFPALLSAGPGPAVPPATGKPRLVTIGGQVGVNYANLNFNRGYPRPATPVGAAFRPGLVAGPSLRVAFGRRLALEQAYLFSQLRGANRNTATRYNFLYLSLPLALRYQLLPRLALLAGPQFDLLVRARQTTGGITSTTTHDTEERSVGAAAGVEVRLPGPVSLRARYVHGLNHVGIGQRSQVEEFKYEIVQLTAGIEF